MNSPTLMILGIRTSRVCKWLRTLHAQYSLSYHQVSVTENDTTYHVLYSLLEKTNQECVFFDSNRNMNLHDASTILLRFPDWPFILELKSLDGIGNQKHKTETFNVGSPGGCKLYIQPACWTRYGIKVLGRHPTDDWFFGLFVLLIEPSASELWSIILFV